jgi:ornithine carbamoyltransferase
MITDGFRPLVYSRELKRNYCNCHCLPTNRITDDLFDSYMSNSLMEKKNH